MSKLEQKNLTDGSISLCGESIPEDHLQGFTRMETINFANVCQTDMMNCQVFRNGEQDSITLQQNIQKHLFKNFEAQIESAFFRRM